MFKKVCLAISSYLFCSSLLLSNDTGSDKIIEFQAQKFKYILETAYQNHPDTLDLIRISDSAFTALLQAMDKESYYYNKAVLKQVQESNKGISYGVGLEFVIINDSVNVIQVFPCTPAEMQGIEIGDIIIQIDDKNTVGLEKNEIDKLIQGDSATTVHLTVKDVYMGKEKNLVLKRTDIAKPGLTTAFLFPNTNVGIFILSRFTDKCYDEFRSKALELSANGMKRIIVDLRGNPGGYMTRVDEILDLFISGSRLLSKSVSNNPEFVTEIYSKDGDILENMPIVVLIDENSASGSELLAGVVQDYDRGIVVGKRSYGKGTVQKIWTMNDTTGFKLTVGKYKTPSGRDIQKYTSNQKIDIDTGLDYGLNKDEIQKKINELGGIKEINIYKSSSGRPIIGGGGVLPDKIIDKDTLTQLTKLLIQRGLYFKWAVNFKKKEGKNLIEKFGKNYSKFNMEFLITDEMLREFATFALENKVWNIDMVNIDKSYFITYMKASIANVMWGYNAFLEVMCIVDNQLIEAIKEIPAAEKMITK